MKVLNIIIGILIFAALVVGFVYVFKGRGSKLFISGNADLLVTNDTKDTISCEYKANGKKNSEVVLKPGETVTGGKGEIRFFTAQKQGSYEITYEYPRPKSAPKTIEFTKLMQAVKKEKTENGLYTQKGTIDDINITYEQILEGSVHNLY